MHKLSFTLILVLIFSPLQAQDITGTWNGILNVQQSQLNLVFHIEKTENGYSATFDSPDQGAMGIPFSGVNYEKPEIELISKNIAASYEGTVSADSITGEWKQGGSSFPLTMYRKEVQKEEKKRPQEPQKPYPYEELEVGFENKIDEVRLAGTLTIPRAGGPHPAAILISGSGPQNRDEEIFGHKPFLVLADHLTRKGIAVLRYDDRGTASSSGNFASATSEDFARDAESAIAFLKAHPKIDAAQIGLIGHSEGGLIASMIAADSDNVSFIVLLAGTGVPGRKISEMQAQTFRDFEVPDEQAYENFIGKTYDIATSKEDRQTKQEKLLAHYQNIRPVLENMLPPGNVDPFIQQQVNGLLQPWMQFFLTYNPADDLRKISDVPVLSLNGSKDMQVIPQMNQPEIRKALEQAGNNDFTVKELPGLNHMFQESETGRMNEYAEIQQTFSPAAMNEISSWILTRVRKN